MENIYSSSLEEQFKNECEVVNLKYEYPGFTGEEKWAVITALSEKVLMERYAELLVVYAPYVILSPEHGEVWKCYHRNQKKHDMRRTRSESIFGFDEDTENVHSEIITESMEDEYIRQQDYKKLYEALSSLTATQRRRVEMYFFHSMPLRKIAEREGVGFTKIEKSITVALDKMKKFFV